MFKKYLILSIFLFFTLFITASVIKNKSRNIEKEIVKLQKDIFYLEKNLKELEIDYIYLSSPAKLNEKIQQIKNVKYTNYDYSKFFFSIEDFINRGKQQLKIAENKIKN